MTVRQLAAQVLMIPVHGFTAREVTEAQASRNRRLYGQDTPAEVIEALQPGGVILMDHNLPDDGGRADTSRHVPELLAGVQRAAERPLLVAVDQEQGLVNRLGPPLTQFPGAMALGAAGDPALARRVAAAVGRELRSLGVTMNLAPVADVNREAANPVIGVRSFGSDPQLVADMVRAQVTGYQADAGIAAAVKHYPGHGDTLTDSHEDLPTIAHDLGTVRSVDLPPFQAAIRAGTAAVMPGHLLVPAIDPDRPATLSEDLLHRILREQLGFDGLVISDSLRMGALREAGGAGTVAVQALRAGVDLLLMPPDVPATIDAIKRAVTTEGGLSRQRLEGAARNVLALKYRLDLDAGAPSDLEVPREEQLARHRDLSVRVGQEATTLLGGRCPPVAAGRAIGVTGAGAEILADELRSLGEQVVALSEADVAIHLTESASAWHGGEGDSQHTIAVAVGSPYHAPALREAGTVLATFSSQPNALRGLARALVSGRFPGRSPVAIPSFDDTEIVYPVGTGSTCD